MRNLQPGDVSFIPLFLWLLINRLLVHTYSFIKVLFENKIRYTSKQIIWENCVLVLGASLKMLFTFRFFPLFILVENTSSFLRALREIKLSALCSISTMELTSCTCLKFHSFCPFSSFFPKRWDTREKKTTFYGTW